MPGYDGTGPNGEGPKTGRKFGYCESKDVPTERPSFRRFSRLERKTLDTDYHRGAGLGPCGNGVPRGGGQGRGARGRRWRR